MIAPLDVEIMVIAQRIHDDMSTWTAVIDVTYDMQQVNGKALNQVTHSDDKVISTSSRYNCTDNHIDISMLVGLNARLMHQLLNDV